MDQNVNKSMSEEERLALASKLDQELDEFINGLEKKAYTDGWPEDKWQEEFDKHPFFMKKAPEPGQELHPLLEGIQQLKYDPEENTAEELAVSYKEDGNFNFKHKNYRLAILSYTEGIKQKHDNTVLLATLYNNRAASNFFLKNFRSCLRDCETALKLNPNYTKAQIRAAQSTFEIGQWDKCAEFCDRILAKNPEDSTILQLRQKAVLAKKTAERDSRKRQKEENARKNAEDELFNEIKRRGVKLSSYNLTSSTPVHLENNQLVWPVGLVYPEVGTVDFIQEFNERNTFEDQLKEVLSEPAGWDPQFRYKIDRVNVYFEETGLHTTPKLHFVPLGDTLGQTIARKEYLVKDGTPHFFLLEKGSEVEKSFLKRYN